MFGDSDYNFFAEKIGASELDIIIKEAIDAKDSENDWIKRLGLYTKIKDDDIKQRAINLYEKYVK
jgi:hypothetical protein